VLAVAHRLSTLNNFDRIVMLVDGGIVQDATPAELMRREGLFQSLWTLQAQGEPAGA
jgi:ATP-binding cassette subfamily B protein